MRLHLASAVIAVLSIVPAAWAQEPTAEAPAPAPGEPAPETTDRWVEFTRGLTERLEASGRAQEMLQEYIAWVELDSTDLHPAREGALLSLRVGTAPGLKLRSGGGFYQLAERFLYYGVARGGAEDAESGTPGDPGMSFVIGRLRFEDRKWSTAYRMFKNAYDCGFDPDLVTEWYFRASVNRGVVLVDSRSPTAAIKSVSAMLKDHSDAPGITPRDIAAAKLMLAAAHRYLDERPKAEQLLREVLDANQGTATIHTLLGRIYVDQGKIEDGLTEYRRAMQINGDPSYVDPYFETAEALLKTSPPRPDEALDAINAYLAVNKDGAEGLFVLGKVEEARGNLRRARNLYRRVKRMKPKTRETLLKLIQVLSASGDASDLEEAEEVREQLNDLLNEQNRRAEDAKAGRESDESDDADDSESTKTEPSEAE